MTLPAAVNALELRELHKRFGGKDAVAGLSLSVPPGQLYALPGTGGSALLMLWQPFPVRRADLFKNKQQRGVGQVILSLVFQFGLTGAAFALGSL